MAHGITLTVDARPVGIINQINFRQFGTLGILRRHRLLFLDFERVRLLAHWYLVANLGGHTLIEHLLARAPIDIRAVGLIRTSASVHLVHFRL